MIKKIKKEKNSKGSLPSHYSKGISPKAFNRSYKSQVTRKKQRSPPKYRNSPGFNSSEDLEFLTERERTNERFSKFKQPCKTVILISTQSKVHTHVSSSMDCLPCPRDCLMVGVSVM